MADSAVPITAGSGTNIDTYQINGGDHQQIVREARATAQTENVWQVIAGAKINQVPADTSRVMILMVSTALDRVFLRFDSLFPNQNPVVLTQSPYQWYLDPGDRWEVPMHLVTLPITMLGRSAGGQIVSLLTTAA